MKYGLLLLMSIGLYGTAWADGSIIGNWQAEVTGLPTTKTEAFEQCITAHRTLSISPNMIKDSISAFDCDVGEKSIHFDEWQSIKEGKFSTENDAYAIFKRQKCILFCTEKIYKNGDSQIWFEEKRIGKKYYFRRL